MAAWSVWLLPRVTSVVPVVTGVVGLAAEYRSNPGVPVPVLEVTASLISRGGSGMLLHPFQVKGEPGARGSADGAAGGQAVAGENAQGLGAARPGVGRAGAG